MKIVIPEDATFDVGIEMLASTLGVTPLEVYKRIGLPVAEEIIAKDIPRCSFLEAINSYKSSKKYKELADKRSYDDVLLKLKDFLDSTIYKNYLKEEQKQISLIKKSTIEDFLCSFTEGKKKNSVVRNGTINKKLAIINGFLNTLVALDVLKENPGKNVTYKHKEYIKPDYLTPEQQEEALKYALQGYYGRRNFMVVYFLLNTGARMEGVINLNWSDIDFYKNTITLDEKGSKFRTIPLLPDLKKELLQYYTYYEDIIKKNPNGPVFINLKPNYIGNRISEDAIRDFCKIIYKKLGFQEGDSQLHRFRRTFALNCLEAGMNILQIKFLLGHSWLQTTLDYLRIGDREVQIAMEKHFPFALTSYREFKENSHDYEQS